MRRIEMIAALAVIACAGGCVRAAETSAWVHEGPAGKLVYKTTARGDRIMDFSYAGYGGGGVAIPTVPGVLTVKPSGGDDAPAIQAAIDAVSKRALTDGFRGAVVLAAGTYTCGSTLAIRASGVVLRGAGVDEHTGTLIKMTGRTHTFLSVGPAERERGRRDQANTGVADMITDAYVSSGAMSFNVADGSVFKPGDAVVISRPITREWVHFMQMDKLVRDGKPQTWLGAGAIATRRVVKAVAGNRITLDVPLTDCLDATYLRSAGGATVAKEAAQDTLSHVGVEGIHVAAPAIQERFMATAKQKAQEGGGEDQARAYGGMRMEGVTDAWVRAMRIDDTVGVLGVGPDTSRVTVEDIDARHTVATLGAAKPADFVAQGSQLLFQRLRDTGNGLFYFATQARVTGPIVLRDCTFNGNGHVQPHQRWATGLLVENCKVPTGGIDLMDRGTMGSGHGWTTGWSVAWNCEAKSFQIASPPGVMNWAIGCTGEAEVPVEPGSKRNVAQGTYEAQGQRVEPASLYDAQLKDRLGADAVRRAAQ